MIIVGNGGNVPWKPGSNLGGNDLPAIDTPGINTNTEDIEINNIINDFQNGKIKLQEAVEKLKALGIEPLTSSSNGVNTITFEYKGKPYTITYTSPIANLLNNPSSLRPANSFLQGGMLPLSNINGTPIVGTNERFNGVLVGFMSPEQMAFSTQDGDWQYSKSILKNTYKLTDEQIEEFFKLNAANMYVLNKESAVAEFGADCTTAERLFEAIKNDTPEKQYKRHLEKLENGEYDRPITGKEIKKELEELKPKLKDWILTHYKLTDDFVDKIIEFCMNKLNIDEGRYKLIKNPRTGETISTFKANIYNLGGVYKQLQAMVEGLTAKNPVITSYANSKNNIFKFDKISVDNFVSFLDNDSNDNNFVGNFLANIFNDKFQELGLNELERDYFIREFFERIGSKDGTINLSNLTQYLNYDDQYGWLNDISNIVNEISQRIVHIDQEDIDNATTINLETLFGDNETIDAKYIMGNWDDLLHSSDPGVRKFMQMFFDYENNYMKEPLNNDIKAKGFERYGTLGFSSTTNEDLINNFIITFNNMFGTGDEIDGNILTRKSFDNVNMLHETIGSDYGPFYAFDIVADSEQLVNMCFVNINSTVNVVDQGGFGDCWLLAGLLALSATDGGKDIIKNAISWNDNYTAVNVYLAGVGRVTTFSIDEIAKAFKSGNYAEADTDVMLVEMAMQEGYGDINGDKSSTFWTYFLPEGTRDTLAFGGWGLDDLWTAIKGFLGLNSGAIDLDPSDIRKQLNEIYNSDRNCAAVFSLYTFGNTTWSITTVDGKEEVLYSTDQRYEGWWDGRFGNTGGGHMFAILEVTKNTVTFANPWNSEKTYTVTWEEFCKLGISAMQTVEFDNPPKAKNNQFTIDGKIYNINDVLNGQSLMIHMGTVDINELVNSALYKVRSILDSIAFNITGFEKDKISSAYKKVLDYYKALFINMQKNNNIRNMNKNKIAFSSYIGCYTHSSWWATSVSMGSAPKTACNIYEENKSKPVARIEYWAYQGWGHDDNYNIHIDLQQLVSMFMDLLK